MEQHPIPQDVTGFQFKLIGNMTIKQFAYVAAGVISAVILYYLPLHGAFGIIIKILFIPLFGGSGLAIAFLPIEGRPVDVMTTNLVKAIFSPNQYVYHKVGRTFSFSAITTKASTPTVAQTKETHARNNPIELSKERQIQAFMHTSMAPKNKLDEKESSFLKAFATIPTPAPGATTQPIATKPLATKPTIDPLATKAEEDALVKQEAVVTQQLAQAKKEEQMQPVNNPLSPTHQKVALLEKQMQFIHHQKQELEQELTQLKAQLATQPAPAPTKPVATPAPTAAQQPAATQHVRSIPQDMTKKLGLPHIPDIPNVVVGIVKDARGNVIPNVLVEVKDKEGNPVRAFKTNLLGQFASATPLPAGIYTIELEDPKKKHLFDAIQINPNNQIMAPIEVTSHDEREALRKALFN